MRKARTETPEQRAKRLEKRRLAMRKYRKGHRKAYNARHNAWRKANAERINAREREIYPAIRDKENAKRRAKHAADPERYREAQRRLMRAHPERVRANNVQRYGMTVSQFEDMREAQGGACAICREVFVKQPHIDHCHATGTNRGLLCNRCNVGVGMLGDNPERMEAAASYIRKHQQAKLTLLAEEA